MQMFLINVYMNVSNSFERRLARAISTGKGRKKVDN